MIILLFFWKASSDYSDASNLFYLSDAAEHGSSNLLVPAYGHSVVHVTQKVELDRDELLP